MIEIITKKVDMPSYRELRYKKKVINNKWVVIDSSNMGLVVYKGDYIGSCLVSHNLNKKHYAEKKSIKDKG